MIINPNDKILFMGDSITEKGRGSDKDRLYGGANLGVGYAMMAASMIKAYHPDWNNEFVNKGITGNTVTQVKERWQEDALDINPDVLSIMVGINDICKNIAYWDGMVPWNLSIEELMAQYEKDYRDILTASVKQNPDLKIIMMESFIFPVTEKAKEVRPYLDAMLPIVRKLAKQFGARLVPLDGIMMSAFAQKQDPFFWVEQDGVHPLFPGHGVIAKHWLETAFR